VDAYASGLSSPLHGRAATHGLDDLVRDLAAQPRRPADTSSAHIRDPSFAGLFRS
jgi:hypothetical protein